MPRMSCIRSRAWASTLASATWRHWPNAARRRGLGLDIGSEAVLERYTQWRRFDTVATAAAMDGMNRLFANTNPVLTLLRRAGLMAVNRLGGLKSMFVTEAAGVSGDLPRLLRGERRSARPWGGG